MNLKILILVFSLASCTISSSNQAINEQSQTEIDTDKGIPIGYHNLYLKSHLKRGGNDIDCNDWTFEENSLQGLFKKLEKVSITECYSRCYQYECWYSGNVESQKKAYEIVIHAGGYLILSNEEETLYFIMTKESDLFFSVCDCCETEER